ISEPHARTYCPPSGLDDEFASPSQHGFYHGAQAMGMLLVGSSLARAVTYVLLYLDPPTSFLPSRPPSEVVTAFCLISGGLIFMLSVCAITERGCVNVNRLTDLFSD